MESKGPQVDTKEQATASPGKDNSKADRSKDQFEKHLLGIVTSYTNFYHKNSKTTYLDSFDFSWNVHGFDIFSKYLPSMTKAITSQGGFAFEMTRRKFGNKT